MGPALTVALVAFTAAQGFFCAAAIRLRASAFSLGTALTLAEAADLLSSGLIGVLFSGFFAAAHRFRCASAIRARAALLSLRLVPLFGRPAAALEFTVSTKTALALSNL